MRQRSLYSQGGPLYWIWLVRGWVRLWGTWPKQRRDCGRGHGESGGTGPPAERSGGIVLLHEKQGDKTPATGTTSTFFKFVILSLNPCLNPT